LEAIGRHARGIAHEFNNALHGIRILTDLIVSELPANESTQQWSEHLREMVQRTDDLAQRLRKNSAEPRSGSPIDFDLNEHVGRAETALGWLTPTEVDLQLELADEPLVVHADPVVLERVLVDLCLHARRALEGSTGNTIRIRTICGREEEAPDNLSPGRFHRLCVDDDGPAATEELALSGVRGSLEAAGAGIEIECAPGSGTSIRTLWPAADASAS
jgi:signal transduction histidine kinase